MLKTMKTLPLILIAILSLTPLSLRSAQTASARVYCNSVRVYTGGGGPYGWDELDLTTLSYGINGELAPFANPTTYTHWSWFELYDGLWEVTYGGLLNMNLPAFQDANTNGYDDFFEVSRSVSASSSGVWTFDGVDVYGLSVQWYRSAGSTSGQCTFNLSGYGQFTHYFNILEYTGPLTYTPGASVVSGTVDLVRTESPASVFRGPVQFVKVSANPSNQLNLASGYWTNEYSESLFVYPHLFTRNTLWPTNYRGTIEFQDGDLSTGDEDYFMWTMSITDLNASRISVTALPCRRLADRPCH